MNWLGLVWLAVQLGLFAAAVAVWRARVCDLERLFALVCIGASLAVLAVVAGDALLGVLDGFVVGVSLQRGAIFHEVAQRARRR